MKNILITGSKGNIGKILYKYLGKYNLFSGDLPELDVRDYSQLLKYSKNKDVIIHLAWNSNSENFLNKKIDSDNSLMFHNIYKVAIENKIPRVIMASSVHAQDFENYSGKTLLTSEKILPPDSPYGADKLFMENLGRYYSKRHLEVVCVRFGAVGEKCPADKGKYIWLSGNDCVNLIKNLIETNKVKNNFSIMYGISNNFKNPFNIKNDFNWKPQEGYSKV
jgi:nucleoside-diphosphate-sugar epimerase